MMEVVRFLNINFEVNLFVAILIVVTGIFVLKQRRKEDAKTVDKYIGQSRKLQDRNSSFFPKNCAVLVGVGPGDISLLTIAAYNTIADAELIICDRLVSSEILQLISDVNPQVEILFSRKCKAKGKADQAQNELNDWIIQGLQEGKKTCRLKGGDAFLFGRGMEEVKYVLDHGFYCKVVPGISSSLAAPLSAGISVTKRDVANRVLVCTAHGKYDTFPRLPEFSHDSTLVFLMGVSRLKSLMQGLAEKGFSQDLPVAVVEKATTSKQRVIHGTLETIPRICEDNSVKAPATIVVGKACKNVELPEEYSSTYSQNMGGVIFSPKRI